MRFSSACSTCVTRGAQPPHEVAARVAFFRAPMVVQPFSTAEQMAPLLTLLQEQICASAGSAVEACGLCAGARRQNQVFRVLGQRQAVEHHLQPGAVVVGVADQHRAQQMAPSSVTTSFL